MPASSHPPCQTFEEASAVSVETLPSCSCQDCSSIPTIELSSTKEDFPVETIDISNVQQHDDISNTTTAIAVAALVADSVRESDLEEGRRTRSDSSYFPMRAEFISATFIKETAETAIGIQLRQDNIIDSIAAGSMASASPLHEGDRIFSINKRQCQYMTSQEICEYLKSLVGRITIVAHNKGGTASIVESMVAKAHPTERSGLVLKRVGNSQLLVSNIRPDKVFIDSLLNIGDEVLKINGISCTHLSPTEAAAIIKETPRDVTIVARGLLERGVVVAELSPLDLLSTFASSPAARSARLQQDLDRRRGFSIPNVKRINRETVCMLVALLGCIICIVIVFVSAVKHINDGLNPSEDDILYPVDYPPEDLAMNWTSTNATELPANSTQGYLSWGFEHKDGP